VKPGDQDVKFLLTLKGSNKNLPQRHKTLNAVLKLLDTNSKLKQVVNIGLKF